MVEQVGTIEFLPGTTTPAPRLLTAEEAAAYLRLTEDGRDAGAAVKALNRLVDRHLIRPCLIGRHRRYSRLELDRIIDKVTDAYAEPG